MEEYGREISLRQSLSRPGDMKQLAAPLIISVLLVMTVFTAAAQVVSEQPQQQMLRTAAGVRAGLNPGLSLRHFLSDRIAVTGLVQSNYKYSGRIFTLLYEWHGQFAKKERMKWIAGGGFHTGSYRVGLLRDTFGYYHQLNVNTLGFDGLIGAEYYLKRVPFTIGADLKPYIDIVNSGFGYLDGAISVKYGF